MYEVAIWKDKSLSKQFLMAFADEFRKVITSSKPFVQIGNAFRQFDLTEEAREWYSERTGKFKSKHFTGIY